MDFITLTILTLTTWRLTSLLVNEAGPFDIFERIRLLAGIRLDEYSQPQADNVIGQALSCVWCTSVWVGIGLVAAWVYVPFVIVLCLPLALSAGAVIVDRLVNDG